MTFGIEFFSFPHPSSEQQVLLLVPKDGQTASEELHRHRLRCLAHDDLVDDLGRKHGEAQKGRAVAPVAPHRLRKLPDVGEPPAGDEGFSNFQRACKNCFSGLSGRKMREKGSSVKPISTFSSRIC